jgi:hypothetical protein
MLATPVYFFAQSTRGALAGNVTDTSGAVVVGAKIVAVGVDTGVKTETVSTSSGAYRFSELALGRYNITITAPGFNASVNRGVLITINSTTALNVILKPGAVTESITIDASAPTIESESSDISGTISQAQIEDLPLSINQGVGALRSPESFSFLVPGTTGPGTAGGQSNGGLNNNGVWLMKISGGQSYGAETMLDGASIQRSENNSSFDETSPSIEALQEFKVTTASPSAEFDRTTGGLESFAIKSGTNDFHGTGYTFVRNAVFDANQWVNNGNWKFPSNDCSGNRLTAPPNCVGYLRPEDSKFDYGGTFGGPVRIPNPFNRGSNLYNGKDKTFFFFAWEAVEWHLGNSAVSTVPTNTGGTTGTGERGGDFSAILGTATNVINPCTGKAVLQNQIFDPSTSSAAVTGNNPGGIPCRLPFAGNIIPPGQFSNVAKALVATLPGPNQTALSNLPYGFKNNYSTSYLSPTNDTTYTIRIDQVFTDKSKFFASYSTRENFRELGVPNLPSPYNNSGYPQDFITHYSRAGWDYTFTPTLLNHFNLGYNRTNSINFATQIGAANNLKADGAQGFFSDAFPIMNWDGLDQFSTWGVGNNGDNIDNGARVNDIVSWIKGRHSFKFGVDLRHQQYSVIQENIPTVNFLRSETDVAALGGTPQLQSGNSFASFLLGDVDNSSQTVYNHNPRWNSHYIAGFVQDDIKFSSDLTVNVGMRYSIDFPRKEADNDTSALSLTTADPAAGGLPGALLFGKTCNCNSAWAETWKKDWAPRVGFSYLLPHTNRKAVLRGGGAILYGPLQYSDFGSAMSAGYTQTRTNGSVFTGPGTANGYTPAYNLDTGYSLWTPAYFTPNTDPGQDTCGALNCFFAVGGEVIQPSYGRPAMTSQWSLQLQDQLAQDLILTVGYIGQSAQNLHTGDLTNFNNINPSYFSLGDQLNDIGSAITVEGGTAPNGTKAPYSTFLGNLGQALRPYPQYDFIQGDCCLENLGHASYDALVTSLNRHFRQGFNLQVAYTWSKNLTDADSLIPFSYTGNRFQGQNSTDLKQEKSISIQNTPQQLSISYLYKLPLGKGGKWLNQDGALDRVVGGWEIGGIQRYQSGAPVAFNCATAAPYYQNCFRFTLGPAAEGGAFATEAYKSNKNKANFFNQTPWFKPAYRPAGAVSANDPGVPYADAAFVDLNREGVTDAPTYTTWLRAPSPACADGCSYAPYVFGTGIPRVTDAVTGPVWKSEDFSVNKNIPIYEKVNFLFKAEFINAFNRHHMALPDTAPGDYSYGVQYSTGFGISTGSDILARTVQLSGHINF